jgi:alanine racemase
MERPTRAIINLAAVRHNLDELRSLIPPGTGVIAVVKADAYGHGLVPIARCLSEAGSSLAVATAEEAQALRAAAIDAPILILGPVPEGQIHDAVATGASLTFHHRPMLKSAAAAAARFGRTVPLHLLVDTGMSRLGFSPEEVPSALAEADATPGLFVEGIFTHFAKADSPEDPLTLGQIGRFAQLLSTFGKRRWLRHLANSAGAIHFPEAVYDAIRPGLALYGVAPSPGTASRIELRPAMSLETAVAQMREFPAGTGIGYGHTFKTGRTSRIAVLPIGYADGLPWQLSNRGTVLLGGQRCSIVGRVCMDLTMVDVTEAGGVTVGSPAVLIGSQGGEVITATEVAETVGTISYEIVTRIGPRVRRLVVG